MFRPLFIAIVACAASRALAQTCATYPNTLTNGTTADASQVMANFNCAALTGNGLFTGHVGIGTTSPTYALSVVGTSSGQAYFGSTGSQPGGININNAAGGQQSFIDFSDANSVKWQIGKQVDNTYFEYDVANATTFVTVSTSGLVQLGESAQIQLPRSGYVGIGTSSPGYLLHVNGTAYATGAAGALSDIRHKDKVTPLRPGALATIGELRPVTFVWKDPKDTGMKGEQIGLIAQDVVKVLPSVVLTEDNAEKTMGIKYTEIIPVLIKAIQEQQAEIEALRAEMAASKRPN